MIRVKAITGGHAWELDVRGIPYGGEFNGRDAHNTYFSPDTDLDNGMGNLPPVYFFHGLNPDGSPAKNPVQIGKTISFEDRDDGRWYHVILDKSSKYAARIWEAAKKGVAAASSGSSHLARDNKRGHIEKWPVYELSLMDSSIDVQMPANRYAVAIPRLKALGIDIDEPQTTGETAKDSVMESPKATGADIENEVLETEVTMSKKDSDEETARAAVDMDALAKVMKAAASEAVTETMAPMKARMAAIEDVPADPIGFAGKAKTTAIIEDSSSWKYDNYDGCEIGMAMNVLKGGLVGKLQRGVDPAMQKAFFQRLEGDESKKSKGLMEARNRAKMLGIKANETDFTTNVGFGDEWVGVGYSADLWEKIRQETFVIDRLASANGNRSVGPGQETIVFPLEGSDPEWYTIAQAGDPSNSTAQISNTVPAKALGTGSVTATLAKSGSSTIYTGEMVEDAVLDFVSTLRSRIVISGAEILEAIAINGDTEAGANTNINDITGTPAATDWFMATNGFRKNALVTNTANSRDGGVLTSADFIETIQLMGLAGLAGLNPKMSAYIIDPATHYKALQLLDVKSRDVFSGATIEDGRLTGIYGTPVFVSGQIHKGATNLRANVAGKIDIDTQGNNTTGAIVAVRWDQWRFGFRRDMTMEVERIPRADAWEITSLMRYHLTARDTEASAETYNLTI